MAYFVKVGHPVIGNYYITYIGTSNNVDVLGEYLESGAFEYYNGDITETIVQHLYELTANSVNGIPADKIEALLTPTYQEPWYKSLAASFTMNKKVAGIDPKLLRLRDMLKKI